MSTPEQHSLPSLQKNSNRMDENLSGNVDSSSAVSNMYGNHNSQNATINHGPPVPSVALKNSMLTLPPQVNVTSKSQSLSSVNTTNGTGRKYQCKMCPQIFGSKADLQLHTQIHMRDSKPYKCSQCLKTFANSSYLSQHTRIHLGIKPYRCEICQRKFTQLSHLQQHIRTHTGDKPYKCRYVGCNKAFSQLSNLQSHSRCHQTDKPFKCNSCYKCFSEESSLLEHIPRHKESKHLKTHICQFCGKSYTQETYLAKHMQKHADRLDKHGLNSLVVNSPLVSSASLLLPTENPWPKASESVPLDDTSSSVAAMAAVVATSQQQERGIECSVQPNFNPSRLNLSSREANHHEAGQSDTSGHMDGRGCNDLNQLSSGQLPVNSSPLTLTSNKTTSAFTPIQTGILPISTGNQISLSGSSTRTYFPYESVSFSKSPQVSPASIKPLPSSFPKQFISLRQIRSYASMPNASLTDHPIALKQKGQN